MVYKNSNLPALEKLIERIKIMSFSVQTQYKFLKIRKTIKEETDLYDEQRKFLIENYAEKDNEGHFIILEDGGLKIKADCLEECSAKIKEINEFQVTFPDIYFSLDELEPLGLTLEELELLEPFIK